MSNLSASHSRSSFRDPAGFVFEHSGKLYRQINQLGSKDYELLMSSGLYDELAKKELIVAHKEVAPSDLKPDKRRYKLLEPSRIQFVSYPYEWTFTQLRDAALLTLRVQKIALEHGMILKDASAYNVQFVGKKPIFIDTLSFRTYIPGNSWEGYKQFCEHFIAPLAVAKYSSRQILRTLSVFLDGIPLEMAAKLLPRRSRFTRGLSTHVFLHAASVRRYSGDSRSLANQRKVSLLALQGLIASLERTLKVLKSPDRKTEWGNYYRNTNYSGPAFKAKHEAVAEMLKTVPTPTLVWDFGANNGHFSKLAADMGAYTVAFDIDHNAAEANYLKPLAQENNLILPLIQDLANPSPSLGWAHSERLSLEDRGPADVILALALIHHLAISNTTPLPAIAKFFSRLGKHLIIEFVPKSDSKAKLLLNRRLHPFSQYDEEHFEQAFGQYFELRAKKPVTDTVRVIYLYRAKN